MKWLLNILKKWEDYFWEYGICNDEPARRHRKTGEVQFILWKAGEQGHKFDYWVNFNSSWYQLFIKNTGYCGDCVNRGVLKIYDSNGKCKLCG